MSYSGEKYQKGSYIKSIKKINDRIHQIYSRPEEGNRFTDKEIEKNTELSDNKDMSELTRQELDAKLEAIEARMETRVVSLEGKIDTLITKFENVENSVDSLDNKFTSAKWWAIGTAITTLSIVLLFQYKMDSIHMTWASKYIELSQDTNTIENTNNKNQR